MTRTLAVERATRGVRVNAISPDFFMTPLNQAKMSQARKDKACAVPMSARWEKVCGKLPICRCRPVSYCGHSRGPRVNSCVLPQCCTPIRGQSWASTSRASSERKARPEVGAIERRSAATKAPDTLLGVLAFGDAAREEKAASVRTGPLSALCLAAPHDPS